MISTIPSSSSGSSARCGGCCSVSQRHIAGSSFGALGLGIRFELTVTLDGATYTVDNAGNRTSKTDQLAAVTTTYGYDAIYQLLSATQGANTTESYTYDPVGNRLSSLGVSPYSYNTSNELTSTPNTTYTLDNNGNTLTSVTGSNTTSYTWDFENRLSSVTLPGTGGIV